MSGRPRPTSSETPTAEKAYELQTLGCMRGLGRPGRRHWPASSVREAKAVRDGDRRWDHAAGEAVRRRGEHLVEEGDSLIELRLDLRHLLDDYAVQARRPVAPLLDRALLAFPQPTRSKQCGAGGRRCAVLWVGQGHSE